ncbi:DEIH-box ATPase [Ceratobasidium sp. 428]|nr:DEIH-box ATPase [Ceratobasidium sp. 428]
MLETFKIDTMKGFDKKKLIESVIRTIPNETFAQLVSLSKKITNSSADNETMIDLDMEWKDVEIDDEVGVAVVFEEEEEDEDEDGGYGIRDKSDDEADGAGEVSAGEDKVVVLGGTKRTEASATSGGKVSLHDIDGFWLRRLLSSTYIDAAAATDKTVAALQAMDAESSLQNCENEPMELFDYRNDMFIIVGSSASSIPARPCPCTSHRASTSCVKSSTRSFILPLPTLRSSLKNPSTVSLICTVYLELPTRCPSSIARPCTAVQLR